MSIENKRRDTDKINFSIGAKLVTIISFIVIISLGSITALVSWLVQTDLRITAEENNLETNRRSAMEAETLLANVRSNSRVLIQTITALGSQSGAVQETADFFFAENSQIAAVFFVNSGSQEQFFVNRRFFSSMNIDEALAQSYFNSQRAPMGRAVRGETLLQNAAPFFSRSILALFFPWQSGSGASMGVGGVLFSSETLNNNFGFGTNKSFMINSGGDVLSHADFSFLRDGINISNQDFVRIFLDSPEISRQMLLHTSFGVFQSMANEVDRGIITFVWQKIKPVVQPVLDGIAGFLRNSGGIKEKSAGEPRQFMAYTKLNTAGVVVITSIEYDKVFEGVAATTRRNIYLTVAVLCISIILVLLFSKTISVPLKSLAAAAQQIEVGVFDMQLQSMNRRDEIGVLTSSFQKMCSALNIFGRFTNKEIAVKAMRGEIKPGGLPKHGTVFFSDIRSFTAKSEIFTNVFGDEASDKIVHWLNHYFTHMVECVEKTNGVVDKFIGDAVMAHWGTAYTAGSPAKDAFNCVKAALMMRKALYYLNQKRKPDDMGDPPISIGAGINTGIVTAGQLGSDLRMEYTVIGDPVNLASRIESLNKPLGTDILISEDTWRFVKDHFITEEMPSVTVKGKEKPVRLFAVVNHVAVTTGPKTLAEVRDMLGIKPPDVSKADVNAEEKKYQIGGTK